MKENPQQDKGSEVAKILRAVNYTKTSGTVYNAQMYESAYHSVRLKDKYFRGQRQPGERLKKVPFDFKDKIVLDLGCNIGGMLFEIQKEIKAGIGFDVDSKCVNAANLIKRYNQTDNLDFFVFDLDGEPFQVLDDLILPEQIDICFLLSVCMWLKKWKEVINYCSNKSKALLFETNGTAQQQEEQVLYLKQCYKKTVLVDSSSMDDPIQHNRILIYCENP